jgi:hypothetical protein
MTFYITDDDVAKLNISLDQAITLKSDSRYAGMLGVMHNLNYLVSAFDLKKYKSTLGYILIL